MILQEIAATRDSPDEIAYDLLQDAAFPSQAIGRADPRHARERRSASPPPTCEAFCAATIAPDTHGAFSRRRRRSRRASCATLRPYSVGSLAEAAPRESSRPRYVGGHARLGEAVRAEPSRDRFRRSVLPRAGVLHRPGVLGAVRRAECRRGCSRRSARSAASATRSTRPLGAEAMPGCSALHAATGPE